MSFTNKFVHGSSHYKKEKEKARTLRKSNWWKNLIQKGICHYCEKKFSPSDLTMDHIVPISKGGKSTKGNIVAACKSCNNDKKSQTPADMIINNLENKKNN